MHYYPPYANGNGAEYFINISILIINSLIGKFKNSDLITVIHPNKAYLTPIAFSIGILDLYVMLTNSLNSFNVTTPFFCAKECFKPYFIVYNMVFHLLNTFNLSIFLHFCSSFLYFLTDRSIGNSGLEHD